LKNGSRRVKIDALLFDAVEAPAFELAVQAGGRTHFDPARGYVPELSAEGRAAPGVFCAGRVTGNAVDASESGRAVARVVASELSNP
jgi:hypothetical protein